jgi:hypothetical protein
VTEPYSPWQQAAEGCICELKRGSGAANIKVILELSLSWYFPEPPKGPTDLFKEFLQKPG